MADALAPATRGALPPLTDKLVPEDSCSGLACAWPLRAPLAAISVAGGKLVWRLLSLFEQLGSFSRLVLRLLDVWHLHGAWWLTALFRSGLVLRLRRCPGVWASWAVAVLVSTSYVTVFCPSPC